MLDLSETISTLRREGGDLPGIEVKAGAGGFPDSLIPTLCSFANRPGGGTVIIGLDEASGFTAVGLTDPRATKEMLASKARHSFEPPVTVEVDEATVDGKAVVVGIVSEAEQSQKPCRVAGGGHRGVWIRAWDGDYQASELEIQGLLAARSQPRFDAAPAPAATMEDLNAEMVVDFLRTCRQSSTQLADIRDDTELLWRMGVTAAKGGPPTVAGILAMGIYPQQHLPGAALQAVLAAPPSATRAVRALDAVRFDGPIPRIIDDATNWVARSTPTAIVSDASTGRVTDRPTWPRDAVRELVGNALIHRDLAPWSLGETGLLRIGDGKLVIRNPGGLYGLKVSRLGHIGVTSARNATLTRICQYLRLADGTRAAEVLASGIPTVLEALSASGMPAPIFDDDGLRFTVVLKERQRELRGGSFPAGSSKAQILAALLVAELDVHQIEAATGLAAANIRKVLRQLRDAGLVVQRGTQGQRAVYQRAERT